MRLLYLFLALAFIVIVVFLLLEDSLMTTFSESGSIAWLTQYGDWAWAAGIVLLVSDLVLPLPATLIMSALGFIYGPIAGGLISVLGSFLAGSTGYWLCRLMGEGVAHRLLGQRDFEKGRKLADTIGPWVVALSRWLPVFPEVIACMAGLTRMRVMTFHLALLAGSLPLGFVYALIGYSGVDNPTMAILLSAGVPPVLWFLTSRFLKHSTPTT